MIFFARDILAYLRLHDKNTICVLPPFCPLENFSRDIWVPARQNATRTNLSAVYSLKVLGNKLDAFSNPIVKYSKTYLGIRI